MTLDEEFRQLVRNHIPYRISEEDKEGLKAMLQDCTSVYSPYVWSNEPDEK